MLSLKSFTEKILFRTLPQYYPNELSVEEMHHSSFGTTLKENTQPEIISPVEEFWILSLFPHSLSQVRSILPYIREYQISVDFL